MLATKSSSVRSNFISVQVLLKAVLMPTLAATDLTEETNHTELTRDNRWVSDLKRLINILNTPYKQNKTSERKRITLSTIRKAWLDHLPESSR